MNQLLLLQGSSEELRLFPHIIELGTIKNACINLNAFPRAVISGIKLFFVLDGKFQWAVNNKEHTFYPGDVALVLPGQTFGSPSGILEIGSFLSCILRQGMTVTRSPLINGAASPGMKL